MAWEWKGMPVPTEPWHWALLVAGVLMGAGLFWKVQKFILKILFGFLALAAAFLAGYWLAKYPVPRP